MNDWMPVAISVLVWWFTTGIILFLDGLPRHTFRWSMAGASVALVAALWLLRASAADATATGAYTAFAATILVWGWLEMTFLMGFITGPRTHACPERCAGWPHFLHAAQTVIHNEIALLLGGLSVLALTWQGSNHVALWTYGVLWPMRLSAKLNLFLGVPNLGEKFLPPHLTYLKGFFRKRAMNFLFPLSITASTMVAGSLVLRTMHARNAFDSTAYGLVSSLLVLAILEHWFMIIPLPSDKLWSWAFSAKRQQRGADSLLLSNSTPPTIR